VPQNLGYSVNSIQRKRTNGQLVLQYAPVDNVTTTLDYTYSENKVQQQRNDLSVWFNFGPSASSWTNGRSPDRSSTASSTTRSTTPTFRQRHQHGGHRHGRRQVRHQGREQVVGLQRGVEVTDRFGMQLDVHKSTAESGADSPYGSNAVLGTATFDRGTTTADFSQDFPVISIDLPPGQTALDPSRVVTTGSSFRNSYMKSEIQQAQLSGNLDFFEDSRLDFGVSATKVDNRSAYSNVQSDTWGGQGSSPATYPDSIWHPDTIRHYFDNISGSNSPNLFNQFFTFDFETVRALAARDRGEQLYRASPIFTTDRRVEEKSRSAYLQYSTAWELVRPMHGAVGLRYEKTDVTSRALVPTATSINWVANNEFSIVFSDPGFTKLEGSYNYVLPSVDFDVDMTDSVKFRASYGESIGRPGWGDIQGGQTLNQLVRINGGTGQQGNPGLKPLAVEEPRLLGRVVLRQWPATRRWAYFRKSHRQLCGRDNA
jgi:TonB-dependent receptor